MSDHTPGKSKRPYYATLDEHFLHYCHPGNPKSCWEWQGGRSKQGYGMLYHRHRYFAAHRVSWELVNGPIPEGLGVLHKCDNPPCCNPNHLWLGTHADNAADRDRKGRRPPPKGRANGRAKLTEADVIEIRRLRREGETQAAIAKQFPVSQSVISGILLGHLWAHVVEEI